MKTIEILKTKISILESKDVGIFRDEFTQLVAAVPGDKSVPTLFATLDGLSAESGVTLTDFSLGRVGSVATQSAGRQTNEEKKLGSNLMTFTITVNGNYNQIYSFLSKVNNVRRLFRVNNFQISFVDMSRISVHMGMDAFYSPIASSLGAVESPLDPLSQTDEDLIVKISQMPYLAQSALVPAPVTQTTNNTLKPTLFSP